MCITNAMCYLVQVMLLRVKRSATSSLCNLLSLCITGVEPVASQWCLPLTHLKTTSALFRHQFMLCSFTVRWRETEQPDQEHSHQYIRLVSYKKHWKKSTSHISLPFLPHIASPSCLSSFTHTPICSHTLSHSHPPATHAHTLHTPSLSPSSTNCPTNTATLPLSPPHPHTHTHRPQLVHEQQGQCKQSNAVPAGCP